MKYYKLSFTAGKNKVRQYPKEVADVVWVETIEPNKNEKMVMIGMTEQTVDTTSEAVNKLSKAQYEKEKEAMLKTYPPQKDIDKFLPDLK